MLAREATRDRPLVHHLLAFHNGVAVVEIDGGVTVEVRSSTAAPSGGAVSSGAKSTAPCSSPMKW